MAILNPFLTALRFLTIFPVPERSELASRDMGISMAFFPPVGLFIGGVLAGLDILLMEIFPRPVTDLGLIMVLTVITGGLHLDGLADTFDGLCGGDAKEKILSIMKDSHIGTMGVLALIFVILLKYIALLSIPSSMKHKVLLIMPVISRWSMVVMAYFSPYARHEGGTGMAFVENVSRASLIIASGFVIIITIIIEGWKAGGVVLLIISILTLLYIIYFRKRLGGVTGDILGAANEVNEVMVLLLQNLISI